MGTYPVTDVLTKILNAGKAKKAEVDVHYSNLSLNILQLIKEEGYIKNAKVIKEGKKSYIKVYLKYTDAGKHVISGMKFFSKPSRRVYRGYTEIPSVLSGLATIVLSTPAGVLSDKIATRKKVGGEVMFAVW
ncbi:MAG TPA: 30S ribosomal protein S8 [bacterium]|uniref:Small ribosomal subunit protein uS8 n=1 Tax=uncultured bacterium Rifle_16ft_4_minimus_4564 TaxID=1665161 RepID=A0A0H4TBK7_9BACT|nr:30S ribosomal protein S8, small subunit ribosomal protein S8 [uncultured bacterium Rifle_16ft_4_minimus_4564]